MESPSKNSTFWKKNNSSLPGSIKPVYGANYPPRFTAPPGAKSSLPNTFQPCRPQPLPGRLFKRQQPDGELLTSQTPKPNPSLVNALPNTGTPSFRSPNKRNEKKQKGDQSFQEFQNAVDDAWDVGDDDICRLTELQISTQASQSAALDVIRSHQSASSSHGPLGSSSSVPVSSSLTTPQTRARTRSGEKTGVTERGKREAMQRLAAQKGGLSPSAIIPPGRPRPLNPGIRRKPQSEETIDPAAGRRERFLKVLKGPCISLQELRSLSWSGIPAIVRPTVWKILAGYLPPNVDRWEAILQKKRDEYWNYVSQYYESRLETDADIFRQIHIDIPRMAPLIPIFQQRTVQEIFERILFIWAIRHPASGYVQGINDLVTPFFLVFLQEHVPEDQLIEEFLLSDLSQEIRDHMEADSFWCVSHLLAGIQDNYTFAQPGIQAKVQQLKELTNRIDAELHDHLQSHEVDYLQFSFRWMNNILMRELPLPCTIRLWDTYLSEQDGFATFHLYVCAAFLKIWREELLRQKDFQSLMLLLQNLPTHTWDADNIGLLVAEAFRLKFMFADAPKHLLKNS